MCIHSLISKVKRHHHIRSHSKNRHSKHESIDWEFEGVDVNDAVWKLQAPKFEFQDVPQEWLEQYQERKKALAGVRL